MVSDVKPLARPKRKQGPGFTVPAAAKALQLSEGAVRRAVDRSEIRTVRFAGLRRIPNSELARVRALLELGEEPASNPESTAA